MRRSIVVGVVFVAWSGLVGTAVAAPPARLVGSGEIFDGTTSLSVAAVGGGARAAHGHLARGYTGALAWQGLSATVDFLFPPASSDWPMWCVAGTVTQPDLITIAVALLVFDDGDGVETMDRVQFYTTAASSSGLCEQLLQQDPDPDAWGFWTIESGDFVGLP